MHQKYRAVVELGQQILGAATERSDPTSLQACSEARREREAQTASTELEPFDGRSFERRLKPAPDRLHFGKLGHRSKIPRRRNVARVRCTALCAYAWAACADGRRSSTECRGGGVKQDRYLPTQEY